MAKREGQTRSETPALGEPSRPLEDCAEMWLECFAVMKPGGVRKLLRMLGENAIDPDDRSTWPTIAALFTERFGDPMDLMNGEE